jgi:hypothetical protein
MRKSFRETENPKEKCRNPERYRKSEKHWKYRMGEKKYVLGLEI